VDEVSRRLQTFLEAKTAQGEPRYPLTAVRDCLALLLMASDELYVEALCEPLQRLLGQFAVELRFVGESATADKLEPLLDAYFDQNPPDIGLLEEMRAALREGCEALAQQEQRYALVN
jgi:hypothetical protein